MISQYLQELEKLAIQKGIKSYQLLDKGIDKETVFSKLNIYFENIPNEIYELFLWKNGIINTGNHKLGTLWHIPMHYFLNIDEAINNYRYDCIKENFFPKNFFPILASGGGDLLLFNMSKLNDDLPKIFFYSLSNPDFYSLSNPDSDAMMSAFDNLETFLKTLIICFERNIFFADDDGLIETDDDKEYAISKELNPNSDYWKLRDEE